MRATGIRPFSCRVRIIETKARRKVACSMLESSPTASNRKSGQAAAAAASRVPVGGEQDDHAPAVAGHRFFGDKALTLQRGHAVRGRGGSNAELLC